MRIVVTSDVHKRTSNLLDIIERHSDADLFVNCGDSESDIEYAKMLYPDINILCVCGNCDWYSELPAVIETKLANKKILATHGHLYKVKFGYEELMNKARSAKADICFFGHTHIPYCKYIDGIHYLNPGAACDGNYGIADITSGGEIFCYNAKL